MPNTSATGGYLTPKGAPSPVPAQDAAFRALVQSLLVGLTGLDAATGVRQSWSPKPAPIPPPTVDWVAFAVRTVPDDLAPEEEQLDTEEGGMVQTRNELLELLVSAFGPNAQGYATQMRDGLHVAQNLEALYTAGVGLIRVGREIHVPEKRNGIWYDRWDLSVVLSRESRREYAQLHFLGAAAEVVADQGEEPLVSETTAGEEFVPEGV